MINVLFPVSSTPISKYFVTHPILSFHSNILLHSYSETSFDCFFFFFSSRRRHTRLQGDWSSDVCSSDLSTATGVDGARAERDLAPEAARRAVLDAFFAGRMGSGGAGEGSGCNSAICSCAEIGRASCRERV